MNSLTWLSRGRLVATADFERLDWRGWKTVAANATGMEYPTNGHYH